MIKDVPYNKLISDSNSLITFIKQGNLPEELNQVLSMDLAVYNLLKRMLEIDYQKRISAGEIVEICEKLIESEKLKDETPREWWKVWEPQDTMPH